MTTINGVTTPLNHIDFLVKLARDLKTTHEVFKTEEQDIKEKDIHAAGASLREMYLKYLGTLGLLANLATDLPDYAQDARSCIEDALLDAISIGVPISYTRTLNRFDISVGSHVNNNTSEDLED